MHIYSKDGHYLPGVPQRDLSDEEWAGLTEQQQTLLAPHYDYQPDPAEPAPASQATPADLETAAALDAMAQED